MTVDDLLIRLDHVRRTSRGWMAKCPAHDDRSPSLSICEGDSGRIVLHCFAGCPAKIVCESLSLTWSDLFQDSARLPARRAPRPRLVPLNDLAGDLKLHADLLWLRGQDVLMVAQGLDCSTWTDEDWDAAMDAISSAHRDLERSNLLADAAYTMRDRWLNERKSHAPRR